MRCTPLRRRAPLRRGAGPVRRTPLRPSRKLTGEPGASADRPPFGASQPQRRKIVGRACVVCLQTKGVTPAHVAPRPLGGCDDPDCVVPLCWLHHRAYDTGQLELLSHLEPRWRAEIAHAVMHLGLVGAYRRLTQQRPL